MPRNYRDHKGLLWMLWSEGGMTEVAWFHFVHITGSWKVHGKIKSLWLVKSLGSEPLVHSKSLRT